MADGKDRISELPDEILLCILRRLPSQEEAARSIAISKRWGSVWRLYPIVEYDRWEYLQEFCDASINRFSRDGLLRMKILKLKVPLLGGRIFSDSLQRAFEQLFYSALERKAEEVKIEIIQNHSSIPRNCFTFRLIFNSALKILRLRGIQFNGWNDDQLPLCSNSLRTLCLDDVELDGFYTSLIASSPQLETLELRVVIVDRKLEISNLIYLKEIKICSMDDILLEEIDITAPGLETLSIPLAADTKKFELTAPQLHLLKIFKISNFRVDELISKLESLKSLTLEGFGDSVTKLKFSSPNLEKLTLWMSRELREIDLDCGPRLTEFELACKWSVPWVLQECRINNAPACKWMVRISMYQCELTSGWFVQLRGFIDRFTRFEKVHLSFFCKVNEVRFEDEEVDHDVHPVPIKELEISTLAPSSSDTDQRALLDGLLWACRPRLFSVSSNLSYTDPCSSNGLIEVFLSQYLRKDSGEGRCNWQHQLKDVKIETEGADMEISEDVVGRLKSSQHVRVRLTWY
ncbi:Putative F-box/FBD/LRR-repeat protein At5g56810 [Linum perenne]